ncbi:hypothetical protein V8E53_005471 [Lactarius tabidus]
MNSSSLAKHDIPCLSVPSVTLPPSVISSSLSVGPVNANIPLLTLSHRTCLRLGVLGAGRARRSSLALRHRPLHLPTPTSVFTRFSPSRSLSGVPSLSFPRRPRPHLRRLPCFCSTCKSSYSGHDSAALPDLSTPSRHVRGDLPTPVRLLPLFTRPPCCSMQGKLFPSILLAGIPTLSPHSCPSSFTSLHDPSPLPCPLHSRPSPSQSSVPPLPPVSGSVIALSELSTPLCLLAIAC